jgi:serine/threonine protein kinase
MADRDLSGRTLSEYILRERIGEGGYAAVYRGEQPLLDRNVAIKVLHEERLDDDSRERQSSNGCAANRSDFA